MSKLTDLHSNFDLIAEIGYDLSQHFDGVNTDDRRKKVSTYYLAKVIPECMSLLKIVPKSRLKKGQVFDFPSICSISRNLIEASNLHWYYCVESISPEEEKFRFLLYDYHDNRTVYRLGIFLGDTPEELSSVEREKEQILSSVDQSPIFQALGDEDKRQIVKGRKCAHLSHEQIAKRRGLDVDHFNGIYKLLSSNVHSTPAALSSMVYSKVSGRSLELAYMGLLLTYVPAFVADMIRSIGEMWEMEFAISESQKIIKVYAELLCERT